MDLLWRYHAALIQGFLVTLALCAVAWGVGTVLGILLGGAGVWMPKVVGRPVRVLSGFINAVPFLILLFWAHYPLQGIVGVTLSPFNTAAVLLTTLNIFCVATVILDGYRQLPRAYTEAAVTLGLSQVALYRSIVVPLLIRRSFPQIVHQQILVLHLSLFASLISVDELFRTVQRINAHEYRPVALYSILALLFALLTLSIARCSKYLKRCLVSSEGGE